MYLIFLTILGVVIALASLFLKSKGKAIGARPDYIACESILTKTELEFFKALNSILKKSEVLVCKVRQADIIKPNCNRSEPIYRTLFNKISQKHVDFVICDALTFKPLAIVELNDNSHKRKDRAKRDQQLRESLSKTDVKLFEMKAEFSYEPKQILKAIYGDANDSDTQKANEYQPK